MTTPSGAVPEGAYVGTAGQSNSLTDLNNLNEEEVKRRQQAQVAPQFLRQRDGIWGFFNGILSIVQGTVGLIVGAVEAVVDGIKAIFTAIGSLFGLARQDTSAVDQARVEGELAIVENMSSSLEYLDEIQRVGGAYAGWPNWFINYGELAPHPLPLGSDEPEYRGAFPLAQGTLWHPPTELWGNRGSNHLFASTDTARGIIARLGGTLELLESGLWMIYFQAAVLQGPGYSNTPSDVWCYVTSQKDYVPVGTPKSGMDSYNRITGNKSTNNAHGFGAIHTFGRAGQYLGDRDSTQGGGNTVSGYMMAYLDSPGWFIHMACSAHQHFGGPASTFVFAQKVNSSTLRGDIDAAKADLAAALPGTPIAQQLNEDVIAAMISDAAAIEVPHVEPPTEPPTEPSA